MRKKYTSVVLFACLIMSCSGSNTSTVVISNESGAVIKSLTVEVSGQEKTIDNLQNGESVNLMFQNLHDSHYVLNGKLSEGSIIHGKFGYVTNGMDFRDSFLIEEGGKVEFKSNPQ
jgi:hypothetical protein